MSKRSMEKMKPLSKTGSIAPKEQKAEKPLEAKDSSSLMVYSKSHALTDMGNAARIATNFGDIIRYSHEIGNWFIWDETRWVMDTQKHIMVLAKEVVRWIYHEAAEEENVHLQRDIVQHAKKSQSRQALLNMVDLAKTEPGISISPEQMDSDPMLFNVENGTIDLRTGELHPHNKDQYITKIARVIYDPTATAPRWESFLRESFRNDLEITRFLQRKIGYCLTGMTKERIVIIWYGVGRNGKTVLLKIVLTLLGKDYSATVATQTLMAKKQEGPRNDLAALRGKRLAAASESEDGDRLAVGLLKQATGGESITSRFLFKEFFEYDPQFKVILVTNHRPVINDTNEAIWDRIILLPFDVRVPIEKVNKDLFEQLKEEMPGILNWAIKGCLDWQKEGINPPESIRLATHAYRRDMDPVARFIEECCRVGDGYSALGGKLYERFKSWATYNSEFVPSNNKFAEKMREKEFAKRRVEKGIMYLNIGLKSESLDSKGNE